MNRQYLPYAHTAHSKPHTHQEPQASLERNPNAANATNSTETLNLGWLPESSLALSPSLACRIGVEEALLVTVLSHCIQTLTPQFANGHNWYLIQRRQLENVAPFWSADDIQRLSLRLRERGLILIASAAYAQTGQLKLSLRNLRTTGQAPSNPAVQETPDSYHSSEPAAAKIIAPHWQPHRETLMRLSQHGIPSAFALEQVSEFVTYWRGVNEVKRNWDSAFFQHTIQQWRIFEAKKSSGPRQTYMSREWRPSEDAVEVLTKHAGISRSFIEDCVPEFVLYWREQGAASDNWNRRFRDHINRQWAKYSSALEHDTTPRRISDGWGPSQDVYDVLRLANIDGEFANKLVPEFVLYWRDSNQTHSSWNTKFLQYVKRRWAQREADIQRGQPASASTRELSLDALVNDRSWAD